MSNTYTSEELSGKVVVSNTESNFNQVSNAVVPANEVWYSVDTNTARVGDGVTTWGNLVPFIYGEDLDVRVVQKIRDNVEGLPSENTVPSTYAVDDALNSLQSTLQTYVSNQITIVNNNIDAVEDELSESIKVINTELPKITELSEKLATVDSTIADLESKTNPNDIDSPIYELNYSLTEVNTKITDIESSLNGLSTAAKIKTLPLPVTQGGTGVTSDTALANKISSLGFALSSSLSNNTTSATTASRLATPRTIKVYHYTSGAGNILSSKLYNMSGSAKFDGSGDIDIAMLAGSYTNCNCRCDDDY